MVVIDEQLIAKLAASGVVAETFRRLVPSKKERIIRVAIRLFGAYGFDGFPVERLCAESRISKGSFFQYVTSKADLLELVLLIVQADLAARLETDASSGSDSFAARINAHGERALAADYSAEERQFISFAQHGLAHCSVSIDRFELLQQLKATLRQLVTQAQQRREIRSDIDPELVLAVLVQALLNVLLSSEQSATRRRLWQQSMRLIIEGARL